MDPGLTRIFFFFFGKSSQNITKPVLIFWSSIQCELCLYTLFKAVSYYDLCVLSMSVMAFQKKVWMKGWVGGWGVLYSSLFWIFEFF